jgi:hypothetical protein
VVKNVNPPLNRNDARITVRRRSDVNPARTFLMAWVTAILPVVTLFVRVSGSEVRISAQFTSASPPANQKGVVAPNQPGVSNRP